MKEINSTIIAFKFLLSEVTSKKLDKKFVLFNYFNKSCI